MNLKINEISQNLQKEFREKGVFRHLSPSSLKQFQKSPLAFLEYIAKKDEPRVVTDAFTMGNAFEALFFEPENFCDKFFIWDASARPNIEKSFVAKENREWKKELFSSAGEKTPIEKRQYEIAATVAKIAADKPVCENFLQQKNGYSFEYHPKLSGVINGIPFIGELDAIVSSPKSGKIVLETKSKGDGGGITDKEVDWYIKKWQVALQMLIYKHLSGAENAFLIIANTNSIGSADARLFELRSYMAEAQKTLDYLCSRYFDWYENYDCQPLSASQFYPSDYESTGGFNII